MARAIILSAFIFLTVITAVSANGGDQRVIGSEYLVNLSRSPFTPIAGTKTAMTISFADLKTGRLLRNDIIVAMRVGKGRGNMEFVHEEANIRVEGGVLDWSYTFADTGIHELFINFAFASDPLKVYETPDFLLDVQNSGAQEKRRNRNVSRAIIYFALGLGVGLISRNMPAMITKS